MGKNKHQKPHLKRKFEGVANQINTNGSAGAKKEQLTWDQVKPDFEIDGSILEGGGQILRNTISLCSLFRKSIRIDKIRYGRDQPGLKQQHRTGIELLANLYKADTIGCSHASTQLYYSPGGDLTEQLEIDADTKTAGSIGLLIQQTLPCVMYSTHPTNMTLGGGTNVDFAPHADYIAEIFQPIFTQHFLENNTNGSMQTSIQKRGFYPRGGGCVSLKTTPVTKALAPITLLEKGNVVSVEVKSYFSGRVSPLVAERMSNQARKSMKKELKKVEIECEEIDLTPMAFGDGCYIFIKAKTDTGCLYGASACGAIGVPAETVAQNAVDSLLRDLQVGGCMDEYLQDQLIIFMALASGTSKIKTGPLSLHTQTSIHFTSLITGAKFTVEEVPKEKRAPGEETNIITCEGVSFLHPNTSSPIATTTTSTSTSTTTSTPVN